MKSTLIVVLLIALLGAAFYTRPSEADFTRYFESRQTAGDSNMVKAGWDQLKADQFVKGCTFNDRLLWVDVQKDGRTIYTGAFSHWFSRAQVANDIATAKQKIENVRIESK